jgi:prolyl 4-hydroxylase
MLGYALLLIPLYLFVYLPASSMLHGAALTPSDRDISKSSFNFSSIASDELLSCPHHRYTTHILSQDPLIIYIEGFLSADESAHLLKIRCPFLRLEPNI